MATTQRREGRPWPIRAIAVLLLIQSFWLIGISVSNIARFGPSLAGAVVAGVLSADQIQAIAPTNRPQTQSSNATAWLKSGPLPAWG